MDWGKLLLGKAGKVIDVVGGLADKGYLGNQARILSYAAPELNVSENWQSLGGQAQASGPSMSSGQPLYNQPSSGGGSWGGSDNPVAPNISGQSAGGGTNGGGGNGLTPPVFNPGPSEQDVINQLKGVYNQARGDIEAQGGNLDKSYDLAKGDIDASVADAEATTSAQKDQQNTLFGDVLRNQLRTYQDTARQRQGTFSALGTLDSSAFGEQQFRADQSLAEERGITERERARTIADIDRQFNGFKQKATSELARLGLQYNQGKQAIASALANNNLSEAAAISDAINAVRDRAAQIQNSIIEFGNQAKLLKAQGLDVSGAIKGISGQGYADQVGQNLQNLVANASNLYQVPQANITGRGFISPKNRAEDDPFRFLPAGRATA